MADEEEIELEPTAAKPVGKEAADPIIKIYWAIGVATALILVIFAVVSFHWFTDYRTSQVAQQRKAATDQVEEVGTLQCSLTVLGVGIGCTTEPRSEIVERDEAEQFSLQAQQDVAQWTFAMLLVAVASTFLGGVGVVVVGWTLHETRRTTLATREIGQLQNRAYLDATEIVFELSGDGFEYTAGDLVIFGSIAIKNVGNTPAYNIKLEQSWWVSCFEEDIRGDDEYHLAKDSAGMIAPGQTYWQKFDIWIRLPEDEATKAADIDVLAAKDEWEPVRRYVPREKFFFEVYTEISFTDAFLKRRSVRMQHYAHEHDPARLRVDTIVSLDGTLK